MKKLYFLFILLFTATMSFAQDVAVNGDFESWTGGVLDTWTSEAGTTITEETTTVAQGSSAARFEVITGTQSNTDFRQSISVTAGYTYDVSVQVYHLDNESQARLYADGYRGYSDQTLLNQWQTVTYQYVAASSGDVEFGLRFYDVAGFDGSSSMIIDDFQVVETPAASSCFNLSLGGDNFELVNVTSNSGNQQSWSFSNGVYDMNGYCGNGCAEAVDQWLIFGPLDLTGVSDLEMSLNATKTFLNTDLLVQYTNAYSGCPSGTTWTLADTITETGAKTIDMSSVSGTTVFIGIQYVDDGADGYSDWELSNVILDATNCPSLGQQPTSDCGTCDVTLGSESYTCLSNTEGDDNDTVTVNIPYTGVEATITSVTTTSAGTVAGDDPASVTDGTITITGLSEGDAWDITINGGDCDGTTLSGTVPSSQCDPVYLVINEILADPDTTNGDANGDGTVSTSLDEFVEIYNTGSTSINLGNYVLADGNSDRHVFPDPTVLPAGGFIVVFGGGTPTGIPELSQVASTGALGLNNGGDTVYLKDGTGTVLITEVYGGDAGNNQSIGREPDFNGAFVQHSTITNADPYFSPGVENVGSSLSVAKNEIEGFSVYPNPVNGDEFTISTLSNGAKSVQIFDLLGKKVITKEVVANETINVSSLNTGIYILKVEEEGKIAITKLVIE